MYRHIIDANDWLTVYVSSLLQKSELATSGLEKVVLMSSCRRFPISNFTISNILIVSHEDIQQKIWKKYAYTLKPVIMSTLLLE